MSVRAMANLVLLIAPLCLASAGLSGCAFNPDDPAQQEELAVDEAAMTAQHDVGEGDELPLAQHAERRVSALAEQVDDVEVPVIRLEPDPVPWHKEPENAADGSCDGGVESGEN